MSARTNGFSLIEMLVVTGLMALMIFLGLSIVRNSAAAASKAERQADTHERLRSAQSVLRRHITASLAIPFEINASTGEARIFLGESQRMQWVAPMPGYLSAGGAYLQSVSLQGRGASQALMFQFQELTPDGPLPAVGKPETVLEGVQSLQFAYRGFDEQLKPGPWQSKWDVYSQMPVQVRVRIVMHNKKGVFPEMLITPKLAGASSSPRPNYGGGVQFPDQLP